jgi:4-hydroxy-tetrahydrodipicolinate reductase
MKKILLCGCNGKMGKVVASCVSDNTMCEIVAGVDIKSLNDSTFPVYKNINEFTKKADVIIDFSHPDALSTMLPYAIKNKIAVVIATTGLSSVNIEKLKNATKYIPVFYSANMSLGVNLIIELAKKAASVLNGFDIEIVEKHHNQKIDAPSGTAIMIADAVSKVLPDEPTYIYDRHSKMAKRSKNEIGIHAIRGGTIVGEHEIIFAGRDEVITISHSAASKEIFANGAVNAALYIADLEPGLYDMGDLVLNT